MAERWVPTGRKLYVSTGEYERVSADERASGPIRFIWREREPKPSAHLVLCSHCAHLRFQLVTARRCAQLIRLELTNPLLQPIRHHAD